MESEEIEQAIRDLRGSLYAQRVFRIALLRALPAEASKLIAAEMGHEADVVRAELRAERAHATVIQSFEAEIQAEIALIERMSAAKAGLAPPPKRAG